MRMPTTPRLFGRPRAGVALLAAMLLVLALPACGGGSGSATATPVAATAAAAATTAAVATAGGSGAATGSIATFCGDWGKMLAEAAAVTGGMTSMDTSATSMKDDLAQTSAFLQALSDHAPAEIQPDFAVYAQFWSEFSGAMAKADYDISKIASDPALMQAFQSMTDARLQQATQNIDAWIQKNCAP